MAEKPKHLIVDLEKGTEIYRDYTPQEIAQRDQDAAAFAEAEAERQAEADRIEALKESAKAKLVAGEPLTEEEAAVLTI